MDVEIVILSEVSQRNRNIIWYSLYVESKEIIQMKLFTKQKETHRLREQAYGYQGEGWGEGLVRESGVDASTLLYLKWKTNKVLL